jgi:hypothetical protein
VAADSNAAVYVDGQLLTRKVTRFREQNITADVIPLPQDLVSHVMHTKVAMEHCMLPRCLH